VVGDLALLGRPLVGAVEMERPSHALTTEVVRRLWQG
jgi:UDP-3-O-acyl-N-acetylglucosamine deacetylase